MDLAIDLGSHKAFIKALDMSPLVPALLMFLFVLRAVIGVQRLSETCVELSEDAAVPAQAAPFSGFLAVFAASFSTLLGFKSQAACSSARRAAPIVGGVCIASFLGSVAATAFAPFRVVTDFWSILVILFCEFLMLDLGFSCLAIRFTPPLHLPLWPGRICPAFCGVAAAIFTVFLLAYGLGNYPTQPLPTGAGCAVAFLVESASWAFKRFAAQPFQRAAWSLRHAFRFSLCLSAMFFFISITPFPMTSWYV
jgi:hypothetical protein